MDDQNLWWLRSSPQIFVLNVEMETKIVAPQKENVFSIHIYVILFSINLYIVALLPFKKTLDQNRKSWIDTLYFSQDVRCDYKRA